ncbi:hypothetical protein BS78_10G250300 [Paspalum vaginatum]|nr:hypothetical protein BS78_10G250300 [Paspalum vaginatum]KAJ1260668.1 hypothetical protein BS78_10G250300 [Paspalum vaginatum]
MTNESEPSVHFGEQPLLDGYQADDEANIHSSNSGYSSQSLPLLEGNQDDDQQANLINEQVVAADPFPEEGSGDSTDSQAQGSDPGADLSDGDSSSSTGSPPRMVDDAHRAPNKNARRQRIEPETKAEKRARLDI